jgi:hypothetical protein
MYINFFTYINVYSSKNKMACIIHSSFLLGKKHKREGSAICHVFGCRSFKKRNLRALYRFSFQLIQRNHAKVFVINKEDVCQNTRRHQRGGPSDTTVQHTLAKWWGLQIPQIFISTCSSTKDYILTLKRLYACASLLLLRYYIMLTNLFVLHGNYIICILWCAYMITMFYHNLVSNVPTLLHIV